MNKTELIAHVAQTTGTTQSAAAASLDAILSAISDAVAAGDAVTLIGFGTFKTSKRAARVGRNPRTGAELKIPATAVPKFTPGSKFKEQVNKR